MKKRVIGLDFDDVLIDFNGGLLKHHNDNYGTSLTWDDLKHHSIEKVWNCTKEEKFRRIVEFYHHADHEELVPIEGAVEALQELSKDHTLVVITARPDYIRERTLALVEKFYKESIKDVYFTNQFAGKDNIRKKSDICREIGVEVFVDDHIDNALDASTSGAKVLLLDRPWNRTELDPVIRRVKTWPEIVEILKQEV